MDQSNAVLECIVPDSSDGIGGALAGERFGYHDITAITVGLSVVGDNSMAVNQIIVDAVEHQVVSFGHHRQQRQRDYQHKESDSRLFHVHIIKNNQ